MRFKKVNKQTSCDFLNIPAAEILKKKAKGFGKKKSVLKSFRSCASRFASNQIFLFFGHADDSKLFEFMEICSDIEYSADVKRVRTRGLYRITHVGFATTSFTKPLL